MTKKQELTDIRSVDDQTMQDLVIELGERPFRARQVRQWLWQKGATTFDEMTDLPLAFREKLGARARILPIALVEEQVSKDGTIKCAFKLHDGHVVEGVLIPTKKRMTACISSQVGCSLTCSFCATGKLKRLRNLSAAEIFDQVAMIRDLAAKHYDRPLTNVVYMGMGEPLLNYAEVVRSVELISAPDGMGMSPRRLTISTAGIAKMIRKLADDDCKAELALSLHAAVDEKRGRIMPINEQNSLEVLSDAVRHYCRTTGRDITFEYVLLGGFNDSEEDARDLVRFCSKFNCKVNLIEYNPIDAGSFRRSEPEVAEHFRTLLERKGINARIRRSRGKDIDAACGQLANKNKAGSEAKA